MLASRILGCLLVMGGFLLLFIMLDWCRMEATDGKRIFLAFEIPILLFLFVFILLVSFWETEICMGGFCLFYFIFFFSLHRMRDDVMSIDHSSDSPEFDSYSIVFCLNSS